MALIKVQGVAAATLIQNDDGSYQVRYHDTYQGTPISLTFPLKKKEIHLRSFPAFLEGLLPEGHMLENLLRIRKIDRDDYFSQLIAVGGDVVGSLTFEEQSV